jgi:hypothetical protein
VTPERVLMNVAGPEVKAQRAAADGDPLPPLRVARREASEDFERAYLARVLECSDGRISGAAAIAQVSRQMVHKLTASTAWMA